MKRIAIDMDEVIADVTPKFLAIYEQQFGQKLNPEDHAGKKVYELEGASEIRKHVFEKGFFADLPVMPGSQEGIKELMESYEIYIVTASMEFRNSFEDKFDWLKKHFPFIHWKNIVFCGDKSIIGTDYLLDDHTFNLVTFKGKPLLFTASHNLNENGYTRLNDWNEVMTFFRSEKENDYPHLKNLELNTVK